MHKLMESPFSVGRRELKISFSTKITALGLVDVEFFLTFRASNSLVL